MSKESRELEKAAKREAAGRFNVHLKVWINNSLTFSEFNPTFEVDAEQWMDQSQCLTFTVDNEFFIIPHTNLLMVSVSAQTPKIITDRSNDV